MNALTMVFPYYENVQMLRRQMEVWATYPKTGVEIIVVDDCSKMPAADVLSSSLLDRPPLRLFRMMSKVRWNQDACRNLGVDKASRKYPWLFMLDIDHVVPAVTVAKLLECPLSLSKCYQLARITTDGNPYHSPRNIYVMHLDLFYETGGYDEDLCGYYGTDGEFFDRLDRVIPCETLPYSTVLYRAGDIPDAHTTEYERKTLEDKAAIMAIREVKRRHCIPPFKHRTPYSQIAL